MCALVTGVQTCALPISPAADGGRAPRARGAAHLMRTGSASAITLPRLRGALHPLEALPGGDGWNLDELSDLRVPDSSVAEAAVLVPLAPRDSSLVVLLPRRTDALRHPTEIGRAH